ncbi:MAG: PDZ domain-containing protein [Planctomycetia bacterium]|nr:PDZ domain-containing protein [Planctomycetia bacterium]
MHASHRLAIPVVFFVVPVVAAADEPPPPAQIAAWIDQLGADQFAQREAASSSLVAAGRASLHPLGDAIGRDDLEVASRAVEIVRGFLGGDDEALAAEAEQVLEAIAEGPDSAVSRLAAGALDFHHRGMTEAARAKLETLGAVVSEALLPSGRRGLLVTLNARWRGSSEDLRLLSRLPAVLQVGVFGVAIDAAAVGALGRLRGVEVIQLFGTGVGDEQVAALAAKLPEARIDVRKGGKLGVAGQPMAGPCMITHVQDGSAAAKAGLQIGDVVLTIDGGPVVNFESLTELVGRHGPGDTIKLEIERTVPGEQSRRFTSDVMLDGWE